MSTIKEAVRSVGGAKAAAKACGVSVRAVYKWIAADALPRTEYTGETSYVSQLALAAAEQGSPFDINRLKATAAPRKAGEAAEAVVVNQPERRASERRSGERRSAERREAERRT
ncbi:hypothetical protein [uncultured Stutzerimonas sp.]|uniref:hypothetical protein n=1 Tax=uncultured Stutzerimonas sp. TaxID=2901168 RepID=UPI0032B2C74B|tara:strand:- start:2072 stop:2413 length:342 start_codon:yes stop_codon:yes gene_type:complete